jgi:hypothetical protein
MTACENAKIRETITRRRDNGCRRRNPLREPVKWNLPIYRSDRKASPAEVTGTSIYGAVGRSGGREERRTLPGHGTPCGYGNSPRAEK